jgi:hypothetical protein
MLQEMESIEYFCGGDLPAETLDEFLDSMLAIEQRHQLKVGSTTQQKVPSLG